MNKQTEALKEAKQWFFENRHELQSEWADSVAKLIDEALEQPAQHKWSSDGERCVKCGDKDWMGGSCSIADEQPAQGIELEWYQKGWDDAKREGISKTETTTATIKESLNVEPAQEHVAWECFSDPAYYDMWAIRQVGNRNFEETIHVVNGKEAKQLCAWLNSLNIHTCVLTHSAPSFIGLSDDEVKIIQGGFCNGQYYVPDLVRAIEQALKEKNHG